ncbi:MAG: DUF805 domain-containing protein [Planctomycetes bacterium]|nr:DUF805 domain-containing protein [Planctomycetota bacterium]
MSISKLLFSFNGRINRAPYWAASIAAVVVFYILLFGFAFLGVALSTPEKVNNAELVVLLPLSPLFLWVAFAIQAKRWHDRNKSAAWCLINFVPLIGGAWSFIECGCLMGTSGPNQFGEDPLARS